MSVSLTTITGPVYLPNGATPVGGRVSFELSSWDQEEGAGLVISGPVYTTIDNNGQFSVELYTSTAGVNSVHYRMFVIWEDSELSESYVNDIYVGIPTPHYTKKYIGSFALSGPGPFQVSDLNIISETNNSSFDAYLEMKAFADRIDLGALDDAVAATGADRAAVTPLAAQVAADRVLTEAARDAAQAAKSGAETAATASFVAAGTYADEPTGRAAVADGAEFLVTAAPYVIKYKRIDAVTVSTELFRLLNSDGVAQMLVSLGDLLSQATPSRSIAGSATATAGKPYGITFPIGVIGNGSLSMPVWNYSGIGRAGDVVEVVLRVATSATFTRNISAKMQVLVGATYPTRTAKVTQKTGVNEIIYTINYTLQGDETNLRPYVSIASSAVTGVVETLDIIEFRPSLLEIVNGTQSAGDVTIASREAAVLALARTASVISEGDMRGQSEFAWASVGAGGAEFVGEYGIKVPAGQIGATSTLQAKWTVDGAGMIGQSKRIKFAFKQSAPFTRTVSNLAFTVVITGGSTVSRTSSAKVTTSVVGTSRVYTIDYKMQGDEIQLTPYVQITGGGAAATDETIELVGFYPSPLDSVSDTFSAGDLALQKRVPVTVRAIGDESYGISLGDVKTGAAFQANVQGGATKAGYTVTIPTGQTGNATTVMAVWTLPSPSIAGQKIKLKVGYDLSAGNSRVLSKLTCQVGLPGPTSVNRAAGISTSRVGNRLIYTVDYVLQGDEVNIKPYFTFTGPAAASDETITLTEIVPSYISSDGDIYSAADKMLAARLASGGGDAVTGTRSLAYGRIPAAIPDVVKTVAASGADYTSPAAALAGITDASVTKRYEVRVAPGIYQDAAEWYDKDFVDFVGTDRNTCIIAFEQPDNASEADIKAYSAAFIQRNSRYQSLTFRVKNARYAIHSDSSGNFPNACQEWIDCRIEHLGNDTSIYGTWGAQNAMGCGVSSGQVMLFDGSSLYSKNAGSFTYHTNVDFAAPSIVHFRNSDLTSDGSITGVIAMPLGSFQSDRMIMEGCVIPNDFGYDVSTWLQSTLAKQPANHAEIKITGHGNSPMVFKNTDWGEALRIDSATTGAASSVVVSGSAVKAIFGDGASDKLFMRAGSAGFTGAVWGWGDISNHVVGPAQNLTITSLGQRLGNCSVTAKTLSVVVDGAAPVVVTFNADHTAQSNATVIGLINSALGAAGVASIYMPGARYRPFFADEEQSLKNTSAAGIPMGSVLAYNGSRQAVRLMTSADAGTLFAGIAWEDIEAGKRGRVKTRGWLPITDVRRVDSAAVVFGNTFSIDASNPGMITLGGSQGLLSAIRTNAVMVGV